MKSAEIIYYEVTGERDIAYSEMLKRWAIEICKEVVSKCYDDIENHVAINDGKWIEGAKRVIMERAITRLNNSI